MIIDECNQSDLYSKAQSDWDVTLFRNWPVILQNIDPPPPSPVRVICILGILIKSKVWVSGKVVS